MLVVFDLDFTLWDCGGTWCDHTTPPYSKNDGIILDKAGRVIQLYPDVIPILKKIISLGYDLGIASRTSKPDWADELMRLLAIKRYFRYFEIYPGSKMAHFQSLMEQSDYRFDQMLFFDDEMRNILEVAKLGVNTVFVENGINFKLLQNHLILK